MKYKVLIQHFGDRQYWAGDVREIDNEQDAQTLIDMGLIALPDESVEIALPDESVEIALPDESVEIALPDESVEIDLPDESVKDEAQEKPKRATKKIVGQGDD